MVRYTRTRCVQILILITVCLAPSKGNAGLFAEHKKIGDKAFKMFVQQNDIHGFMRDSLKMSLFGPGQDMIPIPFRSPSYVREYEGGMLALFMKGNGAYGITYGDLTALAGDHAIDPVQLYQGLLDSAFFAYQILDEKNLLGSLGLELFERLQGQHAALDRGEKEESNWQLNYLGLAFEDLSHFYYAGKSFEEQLADIDRSIIQTLRNYVSRLSEETRQDIVDRLFKANSVVKYALLHIIALELAKQAGQRINSERYHALSLRLLKRAFVFNAYADHYLQDSFAPGHTVVRRSKWHALDNKGRHDYYNRNGLKAKNEQGEEWTGFGDHYYDEITYSHAIRANVVSLNEIWNQFLRARKHMQMREDGSFPTSIIDVVLSSPVNNLGKRLRDEITTYSYQPIPFTQEELNEKIRFANSRSGLVLGAYAGPNFRNGASGRSFGIKIGGGYVISKADSGDWHNESKLWLGFSLLDFSYSKVGEHSWNSYLVDLQGIFDDRYSIELGLGVHVKDGVRRATLKPILGYEFKPVTWSVAPSLKLHYSIVSDLQPQYGLIVELRFY